jgi:exopolyphosphatase / guanosine-5'-triphosphate,3'-diphosphate pyrophosphatase
MPSRNQLAAVDLGSNSFRLVIGQVETSPLGEQVRPVDELKETVRIAAGLGAGRQLSQEAQDRAIAALQRFNERLRSFRQDEVRAVATNTFRVARNSQAFLVAAEKALGFPIEVIAGREEARLIYLGAAHALPADGRRRLVVDIGGGSTECIVGTDYAAELLESVSVGSVSVSQRFFRDGAIERAAFDEARLFCREALEPLSRLYREAGWLDAVGTSGTAKALWQLARANFGEFDLSRNALERLEAALLRAGHVDRVRLEGLKADRRPVLAGGLALMAAVFDEFAISGMRYCDGALREGVLYDLLGRASGADMREVTVARMVRRYGVDAGHGRDVAELARSLLRGAARIGEDALEPEVRLLGWAAQLREIGMSIAHEGFHKHGSYILDHCDLPGFSQHEQARLAAIVLGQVGGLSKLKTARIGESDWLPVMCLRLAVIFHRRRDGQIPPWIKLKMKGSTARLEVPADWVAEHPLTDHSLRLEAQEWQRAGAFATLAYSTS